MNRFEESLRLTHGKYVDENQSGFRDLPIVRSMEW